MRHIMIFSMTLILAACGKSKNEYRPGGPFTQEDEAYDRAHTVYLPATPVDKTESRVEARKVEIEIPSSQKSTAGAQPEKIELLLNQMELIDSKVSVGARSGLVRFSAKAIVEEKPVEVMLEGRLNEDSTADLKNVEHGDERVRAEVFCRGEVKENQKHYECDSLFVDLYMLAGDNKFYREQVELESEQEKAQRLEDQAKAAEAKKNAKPEAVEAFNPEKDEGDHGEIPEPLGTYVGRPERVKELFADIMRQKPAPTPAQNGPVKVQPKKSEEKPSKKSMNNAAATSRPAVVKTKEKPNTKPAPAAKPAPKPAPKPAAKPSVKTAPAQPASKPIAKPEVKVEAKPEVKPAATPVEKPVEQPKVEARVVPARVILDMNDDPNRPVDQAIGGYAGGGKLENSTAMPTESRHHYFSKPHENQYWGTYDLAVAVKLVAKEIYDHIFPGVRIRINDFSKKRGGDIPPHQGHQNGLEADIGYLTENSHKQVPQHSKIGNRWVLKVKEMWRVFSFLGGSKRVSKFYVNRSVKPKICAFAKADLKSDNEKTVERARLTLRKMEAIGGHTSHFHLRMECGRYNPRCRTDGEPQPATGC